MKRLILCNLILLLLFVILPKENTNINNIEILEELELITIKPEENVVEIIIEEPTPLIVDNISENGINLIKNYEGLRLTAYKLEGESNYTIGYGHNSSKNYAGQTITKEEAEELLLQDLQRYITAVANLPLELNQNEFDALVSFTYNCGVGSLNRLTKNRTKEQIAQHITAYTDSSSEIFRQGLLQRRLVEKELFLKEVDTNEEY